MLPIHALECFLYHRCRSVLITHLCSGDNWTNTDMSSCQNDAIFTILVKEYFAVFFWTFPPIYLINHISDKFNSSNAANTCLECFLYHRCRSVVTNLISALGAIGQITDTPWVAKMHHETPIEHKVEISILFTSRHRLAWSTLMFKGIWCVLPFFSKINIWLTFQI